MGNFMKSPFLILLMLAISCFAQTEQWTNTRNLSVSAKVCESQSIYLLRQMGVTHIVVGSMATQGDYQGNKVSVFCEPKANASRFLVAVSGNDKYSTGQLGNMILNHELIGSTRFTDSKNVADEAIKRNLIADEDILKMALAKEIQEFSAIYKKYNALNPSLHGKVVFSFTASPSGDVVTAKIDSSELNSKEFDSEFVAFLKNRKFPPINKLTTISSSIVFVPKP